MPSPPPMPGADPSDPRPFGAQGARKGSILLPLFFYVLWLGFLAVMAFRF